MSRSLEGIEQAIASTMDELLDLVPDVDVEPTAVQKERMDELQRQVDALLAQEGAKVDAIANILKRFEAEGVACEVEGDRLYKRAKVLANKRASLAGYVLDVMERRGVKKLAGAFTTLTRIQNPSRVEVADPGALPFQYLNVTYMLKPLAESVRDAVEAFIRVHFSSGDLVLERIVRPKKELVHDDIERPAVVKAGASLLPGKWRLTVR